MSPDIRSRSDGAERRPEKIEREIEQTREELGHTVAALRQELTREHLKERASHYVRARADYVGARLGSYVRLHPAQTTLLGAGFLFFVFRPRREIGFGARLLRFFVAMGLGAVAYRLLGTQDERRRLDYSREALGVLPEHGRQHVESGSPVPGAPSPSAL